VTSALCVIGVLGLQGAQLKFFRAKTPRENAVGMTGIGVGALFGYSQILVSQEYFWAVDKARKMLPGVCSSHIRFVCLKNTVST
jgi:hypothetical protein